MISYKCKEDQIFKNYLTIIVVYCYPFCHLFIFALRFSTFLTLYFIFYPLSMGNDICAAEISEQNGIPDNLNPQSRQKVQLSTAVLHDNPSSNNEILILKQNLANQEQEQHSNHQKVQQKAAETQPNKTIMHSIAKINPITYDKMQVNRPAERRKRINQYEMDAPFNVIMLTIRPGLRNTINQMGHDIFQKYYRQDGAPGWKLHKNGYYVNYLAKKLTAILTQDVYFQGELIEDATNRIFPKSSGILLTEYGRFQGSFSLGKANGDGSFEDRHKQALYKGTWKDGKLVQGVIDSQQYKFKGNFEQNIAQGRGILIFKQHQISYDGQFKKGKYYDKDAKYKTKDYTYEGCFINGKKNKYGVLEQKERDYKNNKVKYRPPCRYEGAWINDIYFTQDALRVAKGQPEYKDGKALNPQIVQEIVVPMIEQQVFEQSQVQINQEQKVGKTDFVDESENFKPKFIWVQPRPQKKKKRKSQKKPNKQGQDEDSDVF